MNFVNETDIPQNDVAILNNHINDILNQLDLLESTLKSQSSAASQCSSINSLAIDNCNSIIHYTVIEDDDNSITISAFEPIGSSISGDITNYHSFSTFSPVDRSCTSPNPSCTSPNPSFTSPNPSCTSPNPSALKNDNSPNDSSSISLLHKSLQYSELNYTSDTISSAETICRPTISTCEPFKLIDDSPFSKFSVDNLDSATDFNVHLNNRSVAYYGEFPYSYGNVHHSPRSMSENEYLCKIVSYASIVLPHANFNSALVHKYADGDQNIPHHSDNEHDLTNDSNIITISLGETRCLEFKNKSDGSLTTVNLSHGDILIMSKDSQRFFTHSIPPESFKSKRLSITLRHISSPQPQLSAVSPMSTLSSDNTRLTSFLHGIGSPDRVDSEWGVERVNSAPVEEYQFPVLSKPTAFKPVNGYQAPQHNNLPFKAPVRSRHRPPLPTSTLLTKSRPIPSVQPKLTFPPEQLHPSRRTGGLPKSIQKSDTVYVSSSMFTNLDPIKLSTESQNAHVFHFNGANAARMLKKTKDSEKIQALSNKKSVKHIFLLTGTNNIDEIISHGKVALERAYYDITELVKYITKMFPEATLHLINILPRTDRKRMNVINQINEFIPSLSKHVTKFVHIDTYYNKMFCDHNIMVGEEQTCLKLLAPMM